MSAPSAGPASVAVIGGGISGLVSAFRLARSGLSVTLFESGDQLGGLGTFFEQNGRTFERFYHCMLPSDGELLPLLEELRLSPMIYWKESEFAYLSQGELYSLNTPLDLLRFSVLPVIDRIRVGLNAVLAKYSSGAGLDQITTANWLRKYSGELAFEKFWKPMLQAKFGDRFEQIPALWFWTRFAREKGSGKEQKGYIRGGYRRIIETLAEELNNLSVKIHVKTQVLTLAESTEDRIELRTNDGVSYFDRVLFCGPLPLLHELVDTTQANNELGKAVQGLDQTLDAQGVINVVLSLRRQVSGRYYWIATVDEGLPFQGVVESTRLINLEDTGGVHLAYLTNYVHRSSREFNLPDDEIRERYLSAFFKLFPDLSMEDLLNVRVFRAPFVEPLYSVGYLQRKPPFELVPNKLYLATTSQVYPQVTSWNGSVGVARQACAALLNSVSERL
jgi:protoporphyrinogen oxidase